MPKPASSVPKEALDPDGKRPVDRLDRPCRQHDRGKPVPDDIEKKPAQQNHGLGPERCLHRNGHGKDAGEKRDALGIGQFQQQTHAQSTGGPGHIRPVFRRVQSSLS